MVARNLRQRADAGELDLIGWDGPVLSFIEVKTRTTDQEEPPEAAVSSFQQRRIMHAAQLYLRRLRREVNYRFDVISVTWQDGYECQVRLTKDAFKSGV